MERRATVTVVMPDSAAAEEAVARLVRLAEGGGVDVVVEPLEDDPTVPDADSGVSLSAEVPADKATAARAALTGRSAEG